MFFRILHRMILWELTKVFVMSLIGITGILLLAGIVAEASQQGLGPAQILAAIPLLIPSTLPYTIPATTLFAACVVYGRLAADNEILAIRAAGINILQVVKPGILLGVVSSGITMGLYYDVIPYSHYLLRAMVFNDAEELLYSMLRKNKAISSAQMPYAMWVQEVHGRKLLKPIFKRRDPHGQTDVVAEAKEAELRVDVSRKMLLVRMRWGTAVGADGSRAYFEDRTWEVPLPNNFGNANLQRARDMTWNEILSRRQELNEEKADLAVKIALETAHLMMVGAPSDLPQHVLNLQERTKFIDQQIVFLDVELQMRPALSMGCMFFILVGCPVGIWFSRSDYLSSFITCFMPIILVYYPLTLCGTGLAKEGRVGMVLMVWGADIVIAFVGMVLFWRLLRN